MNDEEKNDSIVNSNQDLTESNHAQKRASAVLDQFQMMALKQIKGNGVIDLSVFDKEQKDKLLAIMDKNEDHAFEYGKQRSEDFKTIRLKEIDSSNINNITIRWISLLIVVSVIALLFLVLFLKPEYFMQVLAFVAALLGGSGLTSLFDRWKKDNSIGKQSEEKQKRE